MPKPRPSLGVMLLVHQRHTVLPAIYHFLRSLKIPVHLQITGSSPSRRVLQEIERIMRLSRRGAVDVDVWQAPFSPLDRVERFMELRQWQLERLPMTDWAVIWDDDHVPSSLPAVRAALDSDADLVYATKVFFWNRDDTYTTHIPPHRSVFFFRRRPGDAFPLDRTIHAPVGVHDGAKKIIDLDCPLLDYGYLTLTDRDRCWRDYRRVGKIDPATLALVQPPILHEWPGPFPLRSMASNRAHDIEVA